ncbi:MAG: YHS domain-containing protein, partial [Candidatus Acidiferrum sp.]
MSEQTPTPGPRKTLPLILTASVRVKDLVCGMLVDPEKAAAKLEYDGNNHVFCCKGCAEKFAKDPQKYLAAQDAAVKESLRRHANDQPSAHSAAATSSKNARYT